MQVFVDVVIMASLLFAAVSGYATTLYWDANGSDTGFGTVLTGDWNASSFWSTSPSGTATTNSWTAAATTSNDVVFSAVDCPADAGSINVQNVYSSTPIYSLTVKAASQSVKINGQTSARVLTMAGAALFNVEDGAAAFDLDMNVNIAGTNGITKIGAGTLRQTQVGTFTGKTWIREGIFYCGNNVLPSSSALIIDAGALFRLDDGGGRQVKVGSLTGAGSLILKTQYNSGTPPFGFMCGGDNSNTEFSGVLSSAGLGTGYSYGCWAKVGSGTLTLSGTNTYGPITVVSNGTLRVTGKHTGGSYYIVTAGAKLGGTGTITLATTNSVRLIGSDAANRARLAPGVAGAGTLTVANGAGGTNVVFDAYSELEVALTGDTVTKLACGAMDLGGTTDYLTINVTGTRTRSRYVFATYTGSLSGNIFDQVTVTGVSNSRIDYSSPGEIAIIVVRGTLITIF